MVEPHSCKDTRPLGLYPYQVHENWTLVGMLTLLQRPRRLKELTEHILGLSMDR